MAGAASVQSGLECQTYRFGRSRQRFRAPMPDLSKPYVAFIGGSEVFGKFVDRPYPLILADRLKVQCANWGTPGAGPSFFLKDPVVLEACSRAEVCVVSVMSAVPMSNRLYTVFKRRNGRLRTTSEMLRALYPKLDLSEFRFVHNMLHRMYRENRDNFRLLEIELRQAWVARMRELLDDIETARLLVWMSTRRPDESVFSGGRGSFVTPPAFVTREMLEEVRPMVDQVIEYVAAPSAAEDRAGERSYDPRFDRMAPMMPGQTMHEQLADALAQPLKDMLKVKRRIRSIF